MNLVKAKIKTDNETKMWTICNEDCQAVMPEPICMRGTLSDSKPIVSGSCPFMQDAKVIKNEVTIKCGYLKETDDGHI